MRIDPSRILGRPIRQRDVVKGADTVTCTWNIWGYKKAGAHNPSKLVASSDDEPVSEGKLAGRLVCAV